MIAICKMPIPWQMTSTAKNLFPWTRGGNRSLSSAASRAIINLLQQQWNATRGDITTLARDNAIRHDKLKEESVKLSSRFDTMKQDIAKLSTETTNGLDKLKEKSAKQSEKLSSDLETMKDKIAKQSADTMNRVDKFALFVIGLLVTSSYALLKSIESRFNNLDSNIEKGIARLKAEVDCKIDTAVAQLKEESDLKMEQIDLKMEHIDLKMEHIDRKIDTAVAQLMEDLVNALKHS
jgi:predicted  nucleic acid-binding Zn-ribbon protein